ncbi:MAG: hypothetical protein FD152_479 [Xanthobacteraceae bacterium]|nr:MAG: hypothetical protein FD152_479 [Xanthobacteraceae bacterium]
MSINQQARDMQDFFAWLLTEKAQAAVSGAMGGVVRWLSLREDWRSGFISVVVGAICSLYLGPIALPVLEPVLGKMVVDPASRAGLSGFLIGLGGIAVSGFLIDLWQAHRLLKRKKADNE